jgi:hypothetical protein
MDHLLDFCLSDNQRKMIELKMQGYNNQEVADKLKIGLRRVYKTIQTIKGRAAMAGVAPDADLDYHLPVGFNVKGTSTLIDKTSGESKLQWIKTDANKDFQLEMMKECVEALKEDLPKYDPVVSKATTVSDLATVYTMTDCHVGMKAWGKETGADWDLDIAERTITSAMVSLIGSAPASETAIIAQLGDFLHADNIQPMTPTSGHLLDADDRFSKVVQVAIRILRNVIAYALKKHKKIVFINAEGNHDLSSSIWLRELFKAVYEKEKRLHVIDTPLPYYVYKHGETMLAWHHGHLKKNDQLPLMFASQFHDIWGATKKRYCHTGHRHHADEKEHSGMYVVQHSTIAARDAYAARGGWMSERTMKAITYHVKYGEVGRSTVTPEMFESNKE